MIVKHLTRAALPALMLVLLAAAGAWAAPDRTAELSAASPKFEWDGGPVTGALGEGDPDDTLLKITSPGRLDVTMGEPGPSSGDMDLKLYRASANGEPNGEVIEEDATIGSEGSISLEVKSGNYLVRVEGYASAGGTYKGTADLVVSSVTPPDGPPSGGGGGGGATNPPPGSPDAKPVATLGKLAKKVKASKLKGFRGTASDDRGVKTVQVALVLKKGKKCTQLNARGRFVKLSKCAAPTSFLVASGTTSWSFKLKKKLAKGSYTVFARAIDTSNQTQAGYGAGNRRAFKVS